VFWKTIGRLIKVPFAFVLAALTAIVVLLTIGSERMTHAMHNVTDDPQAIDIAFEGLSQAVFLVSALTLIPALAVIIIGEVARIRSWLYYVIGGGLALAAIPLLAGLGAPLEYASSSQAEIWLVFATAGFAGGLIYWLIAGRTA